VVEPAHQEGRHGGERHTMGLGDQLDRLATHTFGLSEVDHAIRTLAGETGEDALHISLLPWGEETA